MANNDLSPRAASARSAAQPRWGRRALFAAIAVLLVFGGIYLWRSWTGADNAAGELLTADAQVADLEDVVTSTGTLQPKDYVDVGTQVSGMLKKLHVAVGAVVKAGDLLAEIDPTVYLSKVDADQAQILNLSAQLADRQAQAALADLQLTRQRNMAADNATTTQAVQTAEQAQKSAHAQVDAILAQLKQTQSTLRGDQANLGYTKIFAPIAGTVVSQTAKQGQTLNANQQAPIVMRIADLSTMTVEAQVSEADIPKLHLGMDVYFTTLSGDNKRYYSTLRQIPPTPTVVNNVVLYDALFDVPNPDQVLMTQMTAQVFFVTASAKDALLVPLAALHRAPREGRAAGEGRGGGRRGDGGGTRGGGAGGGPGAGAGAAAGSGERPTGADPRGLFANGRAFVTVIAPDGSSKEREVKVGVMTRVSAQILSGLEAGEKVVIGKRTASTAVARPQSGGSLTPNMGGRP